MKLSFNMLAALLLLVVLPSFVSATVLLSDQGTDVREALETEGA